MWNRGNPVDYSDPSGYLAWGAGFSTGSEPTLLVGKCVSAGARACASAIGDGLSTAIDIFGFFFTAFEGMGGGGGGLKLSPASMGMFRGGKAPEFQSGTVSATGFLRAAITFLGKGSKEVSKGRYVSSDGLRQVRFGDHETKTPGNIHGHFESYDKPAAQGGKVTETSTVTITPDHK